MQATTAAIVSRGNSNSLRSQRRKTTAAAPSLFYGRMEASASAAARRGIGAVTGERTDESRGYFGGISV